MSAKDPPIAYRFPLVAAIPAGPPLTPEEEKELSDRAAFYLRRAQRAAAGCTCSAPRAPCKLHEVP